MDGYKCEGVDKFYVYILHSIGSGKYYIGQTNNIERRLYEHNEGEESSYTSKFRPWKLLVCIPVDTRSAAVKIERYLKKKPRVYIDRVVSEKELQDYIVHRFS